MRSVSCCALRVLAEGEVEASASWAEEPGEHRWLFSRLDDDRVRVQVPSFPDSWPEAPDDAGEVLIDETCALQDLIRGVAAGARRVLDEHGEKAYRDKWVEHDFPRDDLEALEAARLLL